MTDWHDVPFDLIYLSRGRSRMTYRYIDLLWVCYSLGHE